MGITAEGAVLGGFLNASRNQIAEGYGIHFIIIMIFLHLIWIYLLLFTMWTAKQFLLSPSTNNITSSAKYSRPIYYIHVYIVSPKSRSVAAGPSSENSEIHGRLECTFQRASAKVL